MAWDLAISENGDLIISGHRDLLGRSGQDLIEQRIRLRLSIRRGSWIYDTDGTLGSNLFQLINMPPDRAQQAARAFVNEALRGMNEIVVDDVDVTYDSHSVTLIVNYRMKDVNTGFIEPGELSLSIALPLAAAG